MPVVSDGGVYWEGTGGVGVLYLILWFSFLFATGVGGRDALEGKAPRRQPWKRLDRRLEEVAEAVGAVTVVYEPH